ncbi:MAG: IPT/TIG domain-containing protein [Terriglobales bacterium]|jgi:hypothetical protein
MASSMTSAPSITSISPTSLPAGSGGFNLLLSGQELSTASIVHFGSRNPTPSTMTPCASGSNCETIAASVPANDIATAGSVDVIVSNSSLSSNTVVFTVAASAPSNTPQILAFLSTITAAGGPTFSMVIIGVDVVPNAVVNFGSVQLTPTSLLNCNPGEICPEIVSVPASADANSNPMSGDFAAMEPSGAFASFSTTGSSSSPGTSEVFLAAPFF